MIDETSPVTAVVLTFNEARNLDACLASLSAWTRQIIVVDSGSTDETLAIARRHGATIVTHAFESHAAQWRWALDTLAVDTTWILGLDADQRVTPELRASIVTALARPDPVQPVGYFLNRRQIFRGRWIRHGGYYPKYLLKLFRRDRVSVDLSDLVDHHFRVDGRTEQLAGDLVEDNLNEARLSDWIAKHVRYAERQARQEYAARATSESSSVVARRHGNPDERTAWMKRLWTRQPLYVRPFLYFFYRYVIRLGFLDGRQGLIFHFMQACWYRLLVDVHLDELRTVQGGSR